MEDTWTTIHFEMLLVTLKTYYGTQALSVYDLPNTERAWKALVLQPPPRLETWPQDKIASSVLQPLLDVKQPLPAGVSCSSHASHLPGVPVLQATKIQNNSAPSTPQTVTEPPVSK